MQVPLLRVCMCLLMYVTAECSSAGFGKCVTMWHWKISQMVIICGVVGIVILMRLPAPMALLSSSVPALEQRKGLRLSISQVA